MIDNADALVNVLHAVRLRQPVIHAITNMVTASDVAAVLRAAGARPIMAFSAEEVEEITSGADGLVLNLGTPTSERVEAMLLAGHRANLLGRPVIFDPVGAGASKLRTGACSRILSELRLAVIKGNRAEIGVLTGMGGQLRGLDAVSGPADVRQSAEALWKRSGGVIVVSGAQDLVLEGERSLLVENGHPIMGSVTGTGCMLAALIAAFAAVEPDRMVAASAAVAYFGLAGELAARGAKGPGTFKPALVDSLQRLTAAEMRSGLKIKNWVPPKGG